MSFGHISGNTLKYDQDHKTELRSKYGVFFSFLFFQKTKVLLLFLFLYENVCCRYLL